MPVLGVAGLQGVAQRDRDVEPIREDLMAKLSRIASRLHGLRFAAKAVAEKIEGYYEEADSSSKLAELSTTAHGYASEALKYLDDIERIVDRLHISLGERPVPPNPPTQSAR